jgi:hypothetical protein
VTGSGNVTGGSSITLVASANAGYKFYNWTEGTDILGTDSVITLDNVTVNHTLHANFLSTVGTTELKETRFRIFPTPVSGLLHLESNSKLNLIQVFDLTGKEILHLIPEDMKISISINGWQEGLYILRISSSLGINTEKFVVLK